MDRWTNGRTDGRNFSPFYRTSSPIGAAAQKEREPVAQRHHMVSGTLALLKYLVIYMNVKQGSGPDRGRSPVEWGEIPSIRPSICPSIPPEA